MKEPPGIVHEQLWSQRLARDDADRVQIIHVRGESSRLAAVDDNRGFPISSSRNTHAPDE